MAAISFDLDAEPFYPEGARLLALVAYPNNTTKRDKAEFAWRAAGALHQLKHGKPAHPKDCLINKTIIEKRMRDFDRALNRRLSPAAVMHMLLLESLPGVEFFDDRTNSPLPRRLSKTQLQAFVAAEDSRSGAGQDVGNYRKLWAESIPVMHLVVALHLLEMEGIPFYALLYDIDAFQYVIELSRDVAKTIAALPKAGIPLDAMITLQF